MGFWKALDEVFPSTRHQRCWVHKTAKLMVFKLVKAAAKTWRRLKGANQLPFVIEGVAFTDGISQAGTENRAA